MARSKGRKRPPKATPSAPAAPDPATAAAPAPAPAIPRTGWVPWLLATLSGVLLGLSQPIVIERFGDEPIDPTGYSGALALVGLVPVLLAMRGAGPKRAFALGFVASFVQFTINVQWLVVAMVVFGRLPLLLSWLILAILTGAMAAYVAGAYAVTRMIVGRFGKPMWLVFPVALCAAEMLRNIGPLGGFPWGNIGTSFATFPLLLQPAALFGVYGLVFAAALSSSTLAELVHARIAKQPLPRRPLTVLVALLVAWVAFGAARLAIEPDAERVVKVGLLQGNIEQGIRNHAITWSGREVLDRYHDLQEDALARGAQLLVWPEAAFPLRLDRKLKRMDDQELVAPGERVPQASVVGAVGEELVKIDGKRAVIRSNSAYVVQGLEVVARVDKTHLVPFGEYVPWPLSSLINQIVPIGSTYPGSGYDAIPLKLGDATTKVGTTICYEGIFPEVARYLRKAGAELHVNMTNDGWYGISGAATQHLNFYAMRAVESGIPVVRAANTGKSGWADNRGRLHDVTPIYVDKAVVADVPIALSWTPYATFGDWLAVPCVVLTLLAWIAAILGPGFRQRARHRAETFLGYGGAAVAAAGCVLYYAIPGMTLDEKYATRFLVVVLFALLVGVGALSGRPWGRKAQLVVSILGMVFALMASAFASPVYLLALIPCLALFLAQNMRKHAYQREPDPLVLDDA